MIGIPVINRADLLARCVHCIDVADRIVVIVNSRDRQFLADVEAIAKTDARLEVLPQERNLGIAASWNLLRQICSEEWVTIGSNDCFLHPGSLAKGCAMASSTKAGLLYLCQQNFFLWSRTCVAQVGWYDDSGGFYPAYYEDCDYDRRLDLGGVPRLDVPGAGAEHLGSQVV